MSKKSLISVTVASVLCLNAVTPALAAVENVNTKKNITIEQEVLEKISNQLQDFKKANGSDDAVEKVFTEMTPEAQKEFLDFIIRQKENGDSELFNYHEKVFGEITQEKIDKKRVKRMAKASSKDGPIDVLSYELKKLDLPTPAYYAFLGIGVSISAAAADGPLPIGDIIGIIIAAGSGAVIAWYWDDISDQFDDIVRAFRKAFNTMKGKIEEAFDYLYAEVIIHYADIPKRLLGTDSDGNVIVDLDVFTDRIDGRERREPKTGWTIDKDKGSKPHGGSAWKLKNFKGKRVATLDKKGKILRE
ncbi:hypothetical protein O0555_06170 [Brevibacillus laterosporus]|uniref:hypothetical protein n=1 Tax=Brevibacillus laterosporus TaxID=1465 RepID=UPI001A7E246C|nr:hypothetical protein [Brevibacillus laterosporus]MCR8936937.1 hypothetical protein [Brevibacillus laterosporus]MCZ0839575.1 hypothetical protein [Brevibacillus laterosporus]MCZ0845677.1 hypothetical protein [Brevibacillus laterosporus]MED1913502.1 hypothetical protein [Brevibacillus laterosporus]